MITKLQTIEDVNRALNAEFVITGTELSALKPAERRQRASRIADLLEIRVQLWREVDLNDLVVPAGFPLVAQAVAQAEAKDQDDVKFWRTQAGAR